VWVSAHPATTLKLGTKEVLFSTRSVGWGDDTDLYRTPDEVARRFPTWLGERGRGVLKQGRGNGGNGVWKVELVNVHEAATADAVVRVQDAIQRDGRPRPKASVRSSLAAPITLRGRAFSSPSRSRNDCTTGWCAAISPRIRSSVSAISGLAGYSMLST
jgi:hypothetical protein